MNLHPETGRRYIHVFPDADHPHAPMYAETRAAWELACATRPWMEAIGHRQFEERLDYSFDPTATIVMWALPALPFWGNRLAKLALVYIETLGPDELLNGYQAERLAEFSACMAHADAVIVQTPSMVAEAARRGWKAVLCPTGAIHGEPDWSVPKISSRVGCYGTIYGHREIVKSLNGVFCFQAFGAGRKTVLDRLVAVLTVLHCPRASYPTMRLWQAAATSAAHISEDGDAWPAVAGEHYISIPSIKLDSIGETARMLKELVADTAAMREMAARAHFQLSRFTAGRCADECLVPGLEAWL